MFVKHHTLETHSVLCHVKGSVKSLDVISVEICLMQCFTNYLGTESIFHLIPDVKLCSSEHEGTGSTLLVLRALWWAGVPALYLSGLWSASAFFCAGRLPHPLVKAASSPRLTLYNWGSQEKECLFPKNSRHGLFLSHMPNLEAITAGRGKSSHWLGPACVPPSRRATHI